MATIALYHNQVNQMSTLIKDVKGAVSDYKSELFSLKSKVLGINKSVCNLDNIVSSIQSSTKIQEDKINSLQNFSDKCETFIDEIVQIDEGVEDVVNQNKENFYDKYNYLKPECEKNWIEKAGDWFVSASKFCKENWKSICNVVLAVIAVVAILTLCVLTFGASAVIIASIVGAVVSIGSQLASDIITWTIKGKWEGNWQTYVGSFIGGLVGGALILTGNPIAACTVNASISTFFGENLENFTGGMQRSNLEIWAHTFLSAGTAAIFSKAFDKIAGKLLKNASKTIPGLNRLAGRGSYNAAFKMVLTKLMKGQIKNVSIKTFRNGIVSGLMGDILNDMAYGIKNAVLQ